MFGHPKCSANAIGHENCAIVVVLGCHYHMAPSSRNKNNAFAAALSLAIDATKLSIEPTVPIGGIVVQDTMHI